jgi:tetratricopeptide (TPR) repeat protein
MHWWIGNKKSSRNEDPTQDLNSAIENYNQALVIDKNYHPAYKNLMLAHQTMSYWFVEQGKNPTESVTKAIIAGNSSLQIKKQDYFSYLIISDTYLSDIIYNVLSWQDPGEMSKNALSYLDSALKINQEYPITHSLMSQVYYYNATYKLEHGKVSPIEDVQRGLESIDACRRIDRRHARCAATGAQLHAVAALWNEHLKRSPEPSLQEAAALAAAAARFAPKDPDVLLSVADAYAKMVRVRGALRLPVRDEPDEGLARINQALELAPGWPRALAVKGALHAMQALAQSPPRRVRSAQLAEESLTQAFSANPLLKNAYGELLQLVQKLK